MPGVTILLQKLETELSKDHDSELVRCVIGIISGDVNESTTIGEFVNSISGMNAIIELIKEGAEVSTYTNIINSYGEDAVKKVIQSLVPASLMATASVLEFALI